jgi:ribosomal protein S18 acetylase RimI-like enzyme
VDLVAFVDMAGEGFAAYFWGTMAEDGQSAIEVGRSRALRDEGAFSWRNAFVAELDGKTAGGLVSYLIDDPVDPKSVAETPELVRPLAELEALAPGHWYVNVLAVHPEFRRRGVGAALLAQANVLGKAADAKAQAIIVAAENEPAVRLYDKVGYREIARRPIRAFPGYGRRGDWVLLTKAHA